MFLEINPRLDAIIELPYRCGINFPALAIEMHRKRPGLSSEKYPAGKRVHWFLGDIRGMLISFKERKISLKELSRWKWHTLRTLLRCPSHVTWRWSDPLPSIVLAKNLLISILKKIFQPQLNSRFPIFFFKPNQSKFFGKQKGPLYQHSILREQSNRVRIFHIREFFTQFHFSIDLTRCGLQ